MKAFEKDKQELLNKLQEIVVDYIDIKENEEFYSISVKRELRELKKVISAIKKWKTEL